MGDDAFIATPGIHILRGEYYLTFGISHSHGSGRNIFCHLGNWEGIFEKCLKS
jgi:hypothetical protein